MRGGVKRAACLALALLLGGTVLACGDSPPPVQEDLPWYETDDSGQEQPEEPGSFALAYHRGQTLDPILCDDGAQAQLASLLYEPLFLLDRSFTPRPWLCESYSVSEDGLTYLLTIRGGVTFSDGSSLTADDVAASLRRAMASPRFAAQLAELRSVSVTGEGQVRLTLQRPNAGLPALLEIPVVKDGTETDAVPVGTGPYLYITDGSSVYLSANSGWWRGETLPLERLELVEAKDTETVRHLFTSRAVQLLATDLTGDSATLTGRLDCVDAPTTVMHFLGLNPAQELLSSAAVRRCLSAGIDRETLVEGYLSGHGAAAAFPLPPSAADYPASLAEPYSYEAFTAAAAEAGLTDGAVTGTLRLLVNEESAYKVSMAQAIARSLTAFGLSVTVETLPWETYLAALAAGEFDLYYGEVKLGADWDVSALIGTGGALNYGGWSSQETDALLAGCRTSADHTAALHALCAHLAEEMPLIPICFKSLSVLTHSGTVENLRPTASHVFDGIWEWTFAGQEK